MKNFFNSMNDHEDQSCLYAVGLLKPSDAEQFEALAECDPRTSSLVQSLEEISGLVLASLCPSVAPRPGLKTRILAAIDETPGLVLADSNGRVVGVNAAFTAMCGYPAEQIVGRKPGALLQGPATCPKTARRMSDAVHSGRECQEEILNYHRNGSPYWVRIAITPLRSPSGKIAGYAAVEGRIKDRPLPVAA